jgi:hypothetical protein
MQPAIAHAIMLVFAAVAARIGWFMAHNPERALASSLSGLNLLSERLLGKRGAKH